MTASRNVNRCTPCLNSHHDRCTGCGCIHPSDVDPLTGRPYDRDGSGLIRLDPALVRERLADLERERVVQQSVVEHLADLVDDAERTLTATDRRLADLRAHPAVVAALEQGST